MHEIPEGISPDAKKTWPSPQLINAWLGEDFDFEFRPGEGFDLSDDNDEEAVAQARRFRDVLGRFASGVTVITAMSKGEPVGMTCQSFTSVSLQPPLVLFCPARTSRAWPLIQRSGSFVVNLLSDGQAKLSNQMATKGIDKFADVDWSPAEKSGAPVLAGTVGYIDCEIFAVHEAGDHHVVIGSVLQLHASEAPHALTFYEGKYGTTQPSAQ